MTEKKKNGGALARRSFPYGYLSNRTWIPDSDIHIHRTVSGEFWFCNPCFCNPCSSGTAEYLACALCNRASWAGSGQQTSSGTWISGVCTDCIRRSGILTSEMLVEELLGSILYLEFQLKLVTYLPEHLQLQYSCSRMQRMPWIPLPKFLVQR